MGHFEWKPEYSVGVGEFDDQHRTLVALIDEYVDAMADGRGRAVVAKTIEALLDYTRTHFAAEEMQMQAHGYPAYPAHKAEHVRMVAQAAELLRRAAEVPLPTVDTLKFLQEWLGGHILRTDKAYTAFFRAKGLS